MSEEAQSDIPDVLQSPDSKTSHKTSAPVARVSRLGRMWNAWNAPRPEGVTRFENWALKSSPMRPTEIRIADPRKDGDLIALFHATTAKAGMGPGKLLVVESPIPNAVCMMNGTMAISTGLRGITDPAEQQAVIAHELGHRQNRFKHMWSGLALAAVLTAALYFPIRAFSNWTTPGRTNLSGPNIVSAIRNWDASKVGDAVRRYLHTARDVGLAGAIGYAAASLWSAGKSQEREREADDFAVRVTRNPQALESGLLKVEKRALQIRIDRAQGGLDYLEAREQNHPSVLPEQPEVDQAIRAQATIEAARADLAAEKHGSHPPMHERTARLRSAPTAGGHAERVRLEQALGHSDLHQSAAAR